MAHATQAVRAKPDAAAVMRGSQNFYARFVASVERFGQRTAIEVQRKDAVDRFTYAQLHRMAESAAAFLLQRGVSRGERCIILSDNDAHWVAAYLGVLRLGAVAVPMDTAYKPKQIAALLRDSGARAVITTQKFTAAVREALPLAESRAQIFLLHPADDAAEVISFNAAAASGSSPAAGTDAAVILYSSGTTGDPKGVVLTHANLLAEIEAVFQVVHLDENDAILGVLPLFHALAQMANLLLPFSIGASVVYLESLNTTELLRALQERGISAFCCVPQFFYLIHQRVSQQVAAAGWAKQKIFRALMNLNGATRRVGLNLGKTFFGRVHAVLGPRMHLLVTGGSRFDPKIGADLYKLGLNILQAYGLTETSGAATVMRPNDPHIGSVGQPLPGVEIKIAARETSSADDADGSSPDGEVLIRGPVIMQGYFNRPDVNAQALRDGWLYTGDLGYLDGGGRLYITGRKKEIIVLSSGKNIYPEEIESHYLQSPYIKEMCVMGRAREDEPSAERLYAVVVPDMEVMRERKVLNAKEIIRFEMESASIHLPSHKRVLGYEVWNEDLPRTTTRKLKRFEIERRVREGTGGAASSVEDEAPATISDEEQVWAAQPQVARAMNVIREAAKNKDAVRAGANIELELGLDSMERVELLTHLEQIFSVEVPDEVAHKIYTVRELVDAITHGAGADAGTSAGDTWGRVLADAPEDDPVLRGLLEPKPFFTALLIVVMKLCYAATKVVFRFRALDREKLPREGAFLLCPNHQSYLDAFLLVAALPARVLRKMFFVGASEYFATPARAWLARKINLVPVDPDANLVKAMQAGAFGLRHGKTLIIFPEGERSIDGTVKKFKKGAAILSTHLKAPIVPVAIDGAFEAWPRGRRPQKFARISMKFGEPLPPPVPVPAGASFAQAEAHYTAAAERLRARMIELWNSVR